MAKHTLKSCGVDTARFLNYDRPIYNIMHEKVNNTIFTHIYNINMLNIPSDLPGETSIVPRCTSNLKMRPFGLVLKTYNLQPCFFGFCQLYCFNFDLAWKGPICFSIHKFTIGAIICKCSFFALLTGRTSNSLSG